MEFTVRLTKPKAPSFCGLGGGLGGVSGPAAGVVVAGARALTVSGCGAILGLALTTFGLGLAGVGVLISGLAFAWLVGVGALVGAGGSVTGVLLWIAPGAIDRAGANGDAESGAGCGSLTA